MTLRRRVSWFAFLALCLAIANPLRADDGPTTDGVSLDDLVQRLDSNRFADRQAASKKLAAKGVQAIPALIEAAQGDSREASTRSIDILKQHFHSDNEDLQTAAKEALETIAKADNAAASRRAIEALKPKPAEQPMPVAPAPNVVPQFRIQGGAIQGNIQIQVQGGAGVRRAFRRNANGDEEIEVEENGEKIKIVKNAKSIEIEITKKVDGKEKTEKYSAKDEEELKKKHPDAYKIYEKHSQQGGAIQIRGIQAVPFGRRALPGAIPVRPQFQPAPKLQPAAKPIQGGGTAPAEAPQAAPQEAPEVEPVKPAKPAEQPFGLRQLKRHPANGEHQAAQRLEKAHDQLAQAKQALKRLARDGQSKEQIELALKAIDETSQDIRGIYIDLQPE